MERASLHEVVIGAKAGSMEAVWELYRRFMPYIEKKINEIWLMVEDIADYLKEVDRQIGIAIKEYSDSSGNIAWIIRRNINRAAVYHKKRWTDKRRGFEFTTEEDIASVLADGSYSIEEALIAREEKEELIKKYASMARGDERKKRIVLRGWIEGLNDSEIARVMAHRCGSSFESNRKFIQRFKNRCRQAYVA